jgi:hypothetical protein
MTTCKICAEKQIEINRILLSYKKDKKFYRKVILGLIITLVVTAFMGSDGITLLFDTAKDIIK